MTDPVLLRANITPISPLITDPDSSAFLPVAPHALADFLRDTRVIGPSVGSTHGETISWEIVKNSATMFGTTLRCRRPAIPVPAGATFVRWCDWVGIAEIKEVRLSYYGQNIFKFDRDYLMDRIRATSDQTKLDAYRACIAGDLTSAQRSQLTQNGFTTWTPLMFPFSFDTTQSLPVVTLAQKVIIEVDVEPLNMVLQTDLSTSTAITSATVFDLYADYYQLTEPETAFLTDKSKTSDGIAYLNSNKVRKQVATFSIAPSSTVQSQEVRLFNQGTVKELKFFFIPQQLRTTVYGNDFFVTSNNPSPLPAPNGVVSMGAYTEILNFYMQAGGVDAIRQQIISNGLGWLKNLYFKQYHSGFPGENRYAWSWSMSPETENAALGNLAFANLDTPTLTINFNATQGALQGGTGVNPVTAGTQTLVCYIMYYVYTYIQCQAGEIIEAFV